MKYLLLLAFVGLYAHSYGQSILPKDHYVILPYDEKVYTTLSKNSIPSSLTDSDFVTIDEVLSACIDKYNNEQTTEYKKMIKKYPKNGIELKYFVIDLQGYYRQYIVVENSRGEKEVWVNCFCTIQDMDYWKKQVVFVKDGGKCFFNLRINLTKKTFIDFIVNGDA
jgi:hypothetical protein